MSHIYQPDLAYVQHVGRQEFYDADAPAILARLKSAGIDQGLVVDLGCGDGGWPAYLTRNGYDVIGVDASPDLINIARTQAPHVNFHVASLLEFPIPPCAAVTSLGEPLNYALAQQPAYDVTDFFQKVADALPARGLFLFDILIAAPHEPMNYKTWAAGDDWAVLVDITEDLPTSTLRRDITIFRREAAAYRRSQETHLLKVLDEHEITTSLQQQGFTVEITSAYGNSPLLPRRRAFIARKNAPPPPTP